MVIENELLPFQQWFPWAMATWLAVVGISALVAVLASFVWVTIKRGPILAADRVYSHVAGGVIDLFCMSPRRVLALAGLAFKEAIRVRVFAAFLVFVAVLLVAVWFLDSRGPDPARLYLGFVMTATTYLVLLLALFLSVFSLPTDIMRRTIYTIVTKPVRHSEIVLGRILGFTAIGTLMLAAMGVLSYFFVQRVLNHQHEINPAGLTAVAPAEGEANPVVLVGRTSYDQGHSHAVKIFQDGSGETDVVKGHWHPIRKQTVRGKDQYLVGDPVGMLNARVPIYGKLRYRDRQGAQSSKAENVGNEWTYRQYIEGGTRAAAIWRFRGIDQQQFSDGFTVQMTLSVFRTHKGTIDQPVLGSLRVVNPKSGLESSEMTFSSNEFSIYEHQIPLQLQDRDGRRLDLFQHLVDDGEVEIHLSCVDTGQYFGAAQPDLYLLSREAPFTPNFIKGYIGIWLQMVLVIGFGVMFSTFLNGPVAMMATMSILIGGLFAQPISQMLADYSLRQAGGESVSGGLMFESIYRMVMHSPMTTDLDPGIGATILQGLDTMVYVLLWVVTSLLPDLPALSDVDWVAYGFNIPLNNLAIHVVTALAYLVPLFVTGYFFLKLREVAR
jgi:ABC-type transport system involved in multi-copper enzyme maturation permease subunit